MRLREDRSYGTVYGHTQVAFEQDGRQFGHDKCLIEVPVVDPVPPKDAVNAPDPERSAKMKAIWAQKRAAQGIAEVNS